jgi:hypothetical protein
MDSRLGNSIPSTLCCCCSVAKISQQENLNMLVSALEDSKMMFFSGLKKNGTSEDMSREPGIRYEAQDWLNCVHLLSLSNDNAGNCERNMMSRSNLDKEKMGLDKICGSEGKAQMFDMGWMKNGLRSVEMVERNWCKVH